MVEFQTKHVVIIIIIIPLIVSYCVLSYCREKDLATNISSAATIYCHYASTYLLREFYLMKMFQPPLIILSLTNNVLTRILREIISRYNNTVQYRITLITQKYEKAIFGQITSIKIIHPNIYTNSFRF